MNNEPVAWMSQGGDVSRSRDYFEEMGFKDLIPLYTHPVKELTDEEIEEVIRKHWNKQYGNRNMLTLCKAVLKEARK